MFIGKKVDIKAFELGRKVSQPDFRGFEKLNRDQKYEIKNKQKENKKKENQSKKIKKKYIC